MKIFFKVLISVVLLSFISCGDSYQITPIPDAKELKLVKTTQIPDECIFECFLSDSILVLITECGHKWFSLYNKNNHEHVISFGERGYKPGEISYPLVFRDVDYSGKPIRFYDANKFMFFDLDLHKVLDGHNIYALIRENETRMPVKLTNSTNMTYITPNLIAGRDVSGNTDSRMFFIYNKELGERSEIKYYPKFRFSDNLTAASAYSNSLFANEEKGIIGAAFRHIDMVNFYDENGTLVKSNYLSKRKRPVESDAFAGIDHSYPIFNNLVYGTKEYFYVRRPNASMNDLTSGKVTEIQILKFDWDGNLISAYKTDKPIGGFCVDEKSQRLFSVINTEDPEFASIVEFEL